MSEPKMNVGGQAVLEGVMMRSPRCFAVAIRRKGGRIVVREQPWENAWTNKVAKVPLIRGAITLFESMQNGYSALRFSAEQMEEDLAAEGAESKSEEGASGAGHAPSVSMEEKINAEVAAAAVTADAPGAGTSGAGTRLATVIAVLLFIGLPMLLTSLFGFNQQEFRFHALAGVFKLLLVLGYMSLIRRVPEVRRVFQYHGAEHKAIATYEANEPLTVEYARRHSTRHARCGTTFLIVVIMVSVLVYAAIVPPILQLLSLTGPLAFLVGFAIRILALPLVAGVAYELQRFGARFSQHPVARVFLTPGYWVQGITTIEPSDDQLEIALASLRITLAREAAQRRGEAVAVTRPVVQTFPSFDAFALAYGGLEEPSR